MASLVDGGGQAHYACSRKICRENGVCPYRVMLYVQLQGREALNLTGLTGG